MTPEEQAVIEESVTVALFTAFHGEHIPWAPNAPIAEMWRRAGREALRQMEWARQKRYLPFYEEPDDKSPIIGWAPLTLAPPDWQP